MATEQGQSPELQRAFQRLKLGMEQLQISVQEFEELIVSNQGQEDDDDDENRQNNGQGRVKDPKHDRRLKQNQGR